MLHHVLCVCFQIIPLSSTSIILNFRGRSSDQNLEKFLSDKTKIRRRKLTEVNIGVTFIVWFTEFVGSLLMIFAPAVFGYAQFGTAAGYTTVQAFYFVILPFLYLVNDSDVKNTIVEDNWVRAIRGIFNRTKIEVFRN